MIVINSKMAVSLGSGDLIVSSISICIFYPVFLDSLGDRHMPERVIRKTLGSLYPNNRFNAYLQFLVEIVAAGELGPESGGKEIVFLLLLPVLYISSHLTEKCCVKIYCAFSFTLSCL